MKTRYLPSAIFVISWLAFLAYLASTAGQLPDRVATHFDLGGRPNGWMTRTQCVVFDAAMGLGLPLFIAGVFYMIRFAPNSMINFPGRRREYWLAPERRAETMSSLFHSSFWLASMAIGLIAGCHYLIVQANRQGVAAAQLPVPAGLLLLGCFVAGIAVWFVWMLRRFR